MQRPRPLVRRLVAPYHGASEALRVAELWLELKSTVGGLPGQGELEFRRCLERFGALLCERCCAVNPHARGHFEDETNFDDAVRSAVPIPKRRGSVAPSMASRARTVDFPSRVDSRPFIHPSRASIIVPETMRKAPPPPPAVAATAKARPLPQQLRVSTAAADDDTRSVASLRTRATLPTTTRPKATARPQQRQRSAELPEHTPLPGGHRPWPAAHTPAFPGRLISMPPVAERCGVRSTAQSKAPDAPLRIVGDKLFFVFDGLKDDADLEASEHFARTPEGARSTRATSVQPDDDDDTWLTLTTPPRSQPTPSASKTPSPSPARQPSSAARPLSAKTASPPPQPSPSADQRSSAAAAASAASAASAAAAEEKTNQRKRVWLEVEPPLQNNSSSSPPPPLPLRKPAAVSDRHIDASAASAASQAKFPSRPLSWPEPSSSQGVAQAPPVTPVNREVNERRWPQEAGDANSSSVCSRVQSSSDKKSLARAEKKASKKRKAAEEPKSKNSKKKKRRKSESMYIASICSPNRVPKRLTEALSAAEEAQTAEGGDLFEVEAIREMLVDAQDLCEYFLVKWEGYSESDNTWEPCENLEEFGHHKDRMTLLRRLYRAKMDVSQRIAHDVGYRIHFSPDENPDFVRIMSNFNDQERTRRLDGSELFCVTASAWLKPSPP